MEGTTTTTTTTTTPTSSNNGGTTEEQLTVNPEYEEYDPYAQDIDTKCWFYMDSNDLKQGPFSFKEMFLWWKAGYFPNELMVRTIWEEKPSALGSLPEFFNCPPKLVERIEKEQEAMLQHYEVPMVPTTYVPYEGEGGEEGEEGGGGGGVVMQQQQGPSVEYKEYKVAGKFNPVTGKYQSNDIVGYFGARGLSADRDKRMISNYLDPEAYQKHMNEVKNQPTKKKKAVKGTKKFWKERKEKKRRAKLVAEYLAD